MILISVTESWQGLGPIGDPIQVGGNGLILAVVMFTSRCRQKLYPLGYFSKLSVKYSMGGNFKVSQIQGSYLVVGRDLGAI